jgi:hypothetical protein
MHHQVPGAGTDADAFCVQRLMTRLILAVSDGKSITYAGQSNHA